MWSAALPLPTEQDTETIAQKMTPLLQPGDILALFGDLGMGKTTFSRAMLQFLGVDHVPSPTFTLLQTYSTALGTFYHFDLYRLRDPQEIWELGVEEAFYTGICLIEWPERLGTILPEKALRCSFEQHADSRLLTCSGNKNWQQRLEFLFVAA